MRARRGRQLCSGVPLTDNHGTIGERCYITIFSARESASTRIKDLSSTKFSSHPHLNPPGAPIIESVNLNDQFRTTNGNNRLFSHRCRIRLLSPPALQNARDVNRQAKMGYSYMESTAGLTSRDEDGTRNSITFLRQRGQLRHQRWKTSPIFTGVDHYYGCQKPYSSQDPYPLLHRQPSVSSAERLQ